MASIGAKYKEKEIKMKLEEITTSQEKLDLLRMIDKAIWQAFEQENVISNAQQKTQVPQPASKQSAPFVPLSPQQLAQVIKDIKPNAPAKTLHTSPNSNAHTSVPNSTFDTKNAKSNTNKN
jgi:hypothetical protein